ncbi:MAG: HEPN domain-containing protein [Myxococcales bacterium]|nr:HEPN domain-containing protein [Myxococcales bacterium]
MTRDARASAAAEEMAKAREEIKAADGLVAADLMRIAATRIYWAVFHAVRALLYSEGFELRTHEGVHQLFHLHFVKTRRFEPAAARLLARLQKFREEADYAETYVPDVEGTKEDLAAARVFVDRIAQGPSDPSS